MEFIDEVKVLGSRSRDLAEKLTTEEATKTALILPFIRLLGYDIFNPAEVVPEFQAEAGVKKDQRVDYALLKDDHPIILIEAKAYSEPLSEAHADQLKRYFPFVKTAKIGILTNGHQYRFYTDLEVDNVMDNSPYMEFDVENPSIDLLPKLQELRKDKFDDERAVRVAEQLKYTGQFKALLAKQMDAPEEDFVRFFAKKVWGGTITQSVKEKLTPLLKEAFKQFVEDRISARLKKAAEDEDSEKAKLEEAQAAEEMVSDDDAVETTADELMGFQIVQAIAAQVTDPTRIAIRDNKSYCAILLDDNRNKTIVRLLFKKDILKVDFLGIKRDESAVTLEKVTDLYAYADDIKAIIQAYDAGRKAGDSEVGVE